MQLSSKAEYALVALTKLARLDEGKVESIDSLATSTSLQRPFLEKILLSLKRAGYVESRMGKTGGFRLSRSAREISLASIVRLFGHAVAASRSVSTHFYRRTPLERDRALSEFFKSIRDENALKMENTMIADLVRKGPPLVYLDNSATSFPKPANVLWRMEDFARNKGGSGGRGGHSKSVEAYGLIADTRASIAQLFGATSPECVCFMMNATEALNTAIYGLARPACRIVTTSMEHNSVWRPLVDLKKRLNCEIVVVKADADGICRSRRLREAITTDTEFVVMTCASNVSGSVQPIAEVAQRCHQLGVALILDGAQAGGVLPIDLSEFPNTALAFTGHKGLLGPQGTGGLVLDPELAQRIRPLKCGGTGTAAESFEQPESLPEKFEAGTLNGHGIVGLGAGVSSVLEQGTQAIRTREMARWTRLRDGLSELPFVRIHGPSNEADSVAIISVTVDGLQPTDIGFLLEVRSGVMTRTGLHCAPLAHQTLGTLPQGTVRFSLGPTTTEAEVDAALAALKDIHHKR